MAKLSIYDAFDILEAEYSQQLEAAEDNDSPQALHYWTRCRDRVFGDPKTGKNSFANPDGRTITIAPITELYENQGHTLYEGDRDWILNGLRRCGVDEDELPEIGVRPNSAKFRGPTANSSTPANPKAPTIGTLMTLAKLDTKRAERLADKLVNTDPKSDDYKVVYDMLVKIVSRMEGLL